jgi:hypothetical protein
MAGLVPAIHVFLASTMYDVDARDKPGHDEREAAGRPYPFTSCFSDTVAGLLPLAPAMRT